MIVDSKNYFSDPFEGNFIGILIYYSQKGKFIIKDSGVQL